MLVRKIECHLPERALNLRRPAHASRVLSMRSNTVAFVAALTALTALAVSTVVIEPAQAKTRRSSAPTIVNTDLGFAPGTIVIVNNERRLYYVIAPGKSKRYRVAVGERNERWTGRTFVSMKKVNPKWYPVDGKKPVEGGIPSNPLGKRAIYLDWSLLRIHGTNNRYSIGSAVSNGCIRMFNRDVIDLYSRVHLGAPVIAINARRDAYKFHDGKFTGKLPSWRGQAAFWRQRKREQARERRAQARAERQRRRTRRQTRRNRQVRLSTAPWLRGY